MLDKRLSMSISKGENGIINELKIQFETSSPMIGSMTENIVTVTINSDPMTLKYNVKKLAEFTKDAFQILGDKIEKELLNKYFNSNEGK